MAADCPRVKLAFGDKRCTSEGKYPNIFEKRCMVFEGGPWAGPLVLAASSRATRNPMMVTIRADTFRVIDIVMIGVFKGRKL